MASSERLRAYAVGSDEELIAGACEYAPRDNLLVNIFE